MPRNPLTGRDGVHVHYVDNTMPVPDLDAYPTAGWIYNPRNQMLIANSPGEDSNGVLYADY
jgi:hypothetical protein